MPDVTAANPDIATPELMKAISPAFNSRDVDRIVSHFTDDATFWLARGPEPVGRTLKGKETIARTLAARFAVIPDMRWDHKEYIFAGNRAISVWTVKGKGADGEELAGIDIPRLVRMLGSTGLDIGRDALSPVVDDYDAPFPFTGTIHRVTFNIRTRADEEEVAATARAELAKE